MARRRRFFLWSWLFFQLELLDRHRRHFFWCFDCFFRWPAAGENIFLCGFDSFFIWPAVGDFFFCGFDWVFTWPAAGHIFFCGSDWFSTCPPQANFCLWFWLFFLPLATFFNVVLIVFQMARCWQLFLGFCLVFTWPAAGDIFSCGFDWFFMWPAAGDFFCDFDWFSRWPAIGEIFLWFWMLFQMACHRWHF